MTKFHTNYNEQPWTKISIEELTTPRNDKICIASSWWAITPDGFALIYDDVSPQTNTNRSIVERMRPDCKPVFIEMAFIDHNCNDYV